MKPILLLVGGWTKSPADGIKSHSLPGVIYQQEDVGRCVTSLGISGSRSGLVPDNCCVNGYDSWLTVAVCRDFLTFYLVIEKEGISLFHCHYLPRWKASLRSGSPVLVLTTIPAPASTSNLMLSVAVYGILSFIWLLEIILVRNVNFKPLIDAETWRRLVLRLGYDDHRNSIHQLLIDLDMASESQRGLPRWCMLPVAKTFQS